MKKKAKTSSRSDADIAKRRKILAAVLPQVAFDGWTDAALERGVKLAGFKRGEADLLFPQGLRDVIAFFGAEADAAMLDRIKKDLSFNRMRVRDKITFAVRARLEYWTPQREAVRRMMIWYAMPFNILLGAQRIYKTVDLAWRAAGDASTDFNFYTKRGLLAAVLKATILFWLDDDTPGCKASWKFLDRRIGDVMKAGKTISLMKEWKPGEIVDFVRRKARGG